MEAIFSAALKSFKMNLKTIVKNNSVILSLYQSIGSLILRIAGRFVSCDDNLILFVSYGGRYYLSQECDNGTTGFTNYHLRSIIRYVQSMRRSW